MFIRMIPFLMKFNFFDEDVIDKEKQEACVADQGLFISLCVFA